MKWKIIDSICSHGGFKDRVDVVDEIRSLFPDLYTALNRDEEAVVESKEVDMSKMNIFLCKLNPPVDHAGCSNSIVVEGGLTVCGNDFHLQSAPECGPCDCKFKQKWVLVKEKATQAEQKRE